MAPLWSQYYRNITRIMYVVDTSNLCQIAAAGVLLYTVLAEPQLKNAKVFHNGYKAISWHLRIVHSFTYFLTFPGTVSSYQNGCVLSTNEKWGFTYVTICKIKERNITACHCDGSKCNHRWRFTINQGMACRYKTNTTCEKVDKLNKWFPK